MAAAWRAASHHWLRVSTLSAQMLRCCSWCVLLCCAVVVLSACLLLWRDGGQESHCSQSGIDNVEPFRFRFNQPE